MSCIKACKSLSFYTSPYDEIAKTPLVLPTPPSTYNTLLEDNTDNRRKHNYSICYTSQPSPYYYQHNAPFLPSPSPSCLPSEDKTFTCSSSSDPYLPLVSVLQNDLGHSSSLCSTFSLTPPLPPPPLLSSPPSLPFPPLSYSSPLFASSLSSSLPSTSSPSSSPIPETCEFSGGGSAFRNTEEKVADKNVYIFKLRKLVDAGRLDEFAAALEEPADMNADSQLDIAVLLYTYMARRQTPDPPLLLNAVRRYLHKPKPDKMRLREILVTLCTRPTLTLKQERALVTISKPHLQHDYTWKWFATALDLPINEIPISYLPPDFSTNAKAVSRLSSSSSSSFSYLLSSSSSSLLPPSSLIPSFHIAEYRQILEVYTGDLTGCERYLMWRLFLMRSYRSAYTLSKLILHQAQTDREAACVLLASTVLLGVDNSELQALATSVRQQVNPDEPISWLAEACRLLTVHQMENAFYHLCGAAEMDASNPVYPPLVTALQRRLNRQSFSKA